MEDPKCRTKLKTMGPCGQQTLAQTFLFLYLLFNIYHNLNSNSNLSLIWSYFLKDESFYLSVYFKKFHFYEPLCSFIIKYDGQILLAYNCLNYICVTYLLLEKRIISNRHSFFFKNNSITNFVNLKNVSLYTVVSF